PRHSQLFRRARAGARPYGDGAANRRNERLGRVGDCDRELVRSRRSSSFLKKRTKKLLPVGANRQKFFVSFFQKRNTFFLPNWSISLQIIVRYIAIASLLALAACPAPPPAPPPVGKVP